MAFRSRRSLAVTQSRKLHPRAIGAVSALIAAIACAGCTTSGQPTILVSQAAGATVAFESIDGLPEGQFRKLVQALSEEADARQLAVVSRAGAAEYRVRGYAAAHIRGRRTTVAWLWDVYDAGQQRTLRITGEEQGVTRQKGWAAVDDRTLRNMARAGMQQLAAFLATPNSPPQPAAPERPRGDGMTVAARDDFSPESAGIFRFLRWVGPDTAAAAPAPEAAVASSSATLTEPIPTPKSRPRIAGLAAHAALRYESGH